MKMVHMYMHMYLFGCDDTWETHEYDLSKVLIKIFFSFWIFLL